MHFPLLDLHPKPPPKRSVPPPHRRKIRRRAHGPETKEAQEQSVSRPILWRVFRQKRKGGDDPANVPEANLPGRADAASVVTAQVHGEPADDDGHGGVGAHGHQEEGGVFGVGGVVDAEEDGDAGDGEADGSENEEEAVAEFVRGEGDEEGEHEGGGYGGDGVQLGLDGGVAVGLDDGGGEERES